MTHSELFADITGTELSQRIEADRFSINEIDSVGESPLTAALRLDRPALVETLLANGADPNVKTPEGDYSLQVAYRHALHEEGGYAIWSSSSLMELISTASSSLHFAARASLEISG